jgi:putative Mg2+ transporter-C (MgtC) family protein
MRSTLLAADPTLSWLQALVRIAAAAGLGGLVGLERELDEKAAGLRTHMLVAVGAALFTLAGAYGFSDFPQSTIDPTRIAAQVVTGIGFLGAGIIFRQGFTVRGLTTAASLWLVAAVGIAAGAGFWKGAVIATAAALISLRPLEWMKERSLPERGVSRLTVVLTEAGTTGEVLDAVEQRGELLALRRDGRRLEIELRVERARRTATLDGIAALPQVEEARWQH